MNGKLEVEAGRVLTSSEMRIAQLLVDEGYRVLAKNVSNEQGVRTSDFEVDGTATELKTISNITSPDIAGALARRILEGAGQAPHIIIDAAQQVGMSREIADNAIKRAFVKQTKDANIRVIQIRIIGGDFDVTVAYDSTVRS